MRSTWLIRGVALLLVGAMLPALLAPTYAAASNPVAASYAEWIRGQVLVPDDPAVDKALEEAADRGANTFDRFVEAFLQAYEQERPGTSAARVFTERDLSNDALIVYLQRRYTEIAAEAVLPRLRLTVSSPVSTHSSSGHQPAIAAQADGAASLSSRLEILPQLDGEVASLRTVTPAQPQGP